MRSLLELLIAIQLLVGNAPSRGSLQKENAQIDRVVSQMSSVYRPFTPNISDNILPSSKWSISLNYLDCFIYIYIYIYYFLYDSTYAYS